MLARYGLAASTHHFDEAFLEHVQLSLLICLCSRRNLLLLHQPAHYQEGWVRSGSVVVEVVVEPAVEPVVEVAAFVAEIVEAEAMAVMG